MFAQLSSKARYEKCQHGRANKASTTVGKRLRIPKRRKKQHARYPLPSAGSVRRGAIADSRLGEDKYSSVVWRASARAARTRLVSPSESVVAGWAEVCAASMAHFAKRARVEGTLQNPPSSLHSDGTHTNAARNGAVYVIMMTRVGLASSDTAGDA